MDKVEKSKTAEPKTATTPKSPPASEQPRKRAGFFFGAFKARLFSDIRHYAEYIRRRDLRARRRVYR